jgi:MFS family permease
MPGHMNAPGETPDYQGKGAAPATGARGALVLLLAINLFNYLDRYILAAVEPEIRKQFFPQAAQSTASAREELALAMFSTGWLATAFLVSYMITAPFFGWLATRMSRWVLIGISVAIWSLASGATGLAGLGTSFALLLLTRCLVGIGEAGYGPAAPAVISDMYPVHRRGAVLAWFYMAIPVGSALGYVLGGQVAKHMNWRWPFYLVVAPGLVLAVLCFARAKKLPDAPAGRAGHGRKAGLRDYLAILKIPSYALDTAGMTAMTFAIGGFSYWMPAYLVDSAKAGDLGHVNLVFGALLVVAGLTATLIGGMLGDYFRRFWGGSYFIVSAVGIALSAGFLALMVNTSFPFAWVWLFFALFFLFLNTGPSNTILANVTHPSVRASAFALNILVIHALGDAISPPILGWTVGKHGWDTALYMVCVVMLIAAGFWLWGAAHLKRDTDRAEAAGDEMGGFPVVPHP